MKLLFTIFICFLICSCSNIDFLLATKDDEDILKNKTLINTNGWENPVLKEVLILRLGEVNDKRFFLSAQANEEQMKRSVSENQVAQKIDYKITINYALEDQTGKCPIISNVQTSGFSFTPKSSGYNFASDVFLQNLYEEAFLESVDNFIAFANNKLHSSGCLDES